MAKARTRKHETWPKPGLSCKPSTKGNKRLSPAYKTTQIMPRKPAQRKQPTRVIGPPSEPTFIQFTDALKAAGIETVSMTPQRLLGFILKMVLKDRITDVEIELIIETHHKAVLEFWGKSSN
jgi:hypothetical protein